MEAGFFPLDQELQVPDGHLLPHALDTLVSMSSELPFGRAVKHLERTLGVVVHASTARRQTLSVGQRVLEGQNTQAQPLSACPEENASERMAMSSDGCMVPLVGGVWTEVKVVAVGAVECRTRKDEDQIVTTQITYFARLADAATFAARFTVLEDGPAVWDQLIELCRRYSFGGRQVHDANVVATMLAYGERRLLTFNEMDFRRFSQLIEVVTP